MTETTEETASFLSTTAQSEEVNRRPRTEAELADLIEELEGTGNYRILRRLVPLPLRKFTPEDGLRCAIVVDTETTGLVLPDGDGKVQNPSEIVSLAFNAIAFDPNNGEIKGCIGQFHRFREPSHPIPAAATAIHGIDDERVRGHVITPTEIAEWIRRAAATVQRFMIFGSRDIEALPLMIAHNARFDRKMMEALVPDVAAQLPWACSQTQIPWTEYGYEGTKLTYLGVRAGFFYNDHHSALADADAVVELLRRPLGGVPAMAQLLQAAQVVTHRLYVVTKYDPTIVAFFKARNYRWSNGDGGPRAWYCDGDDKVLAKEIEYLRQAGFGNILTRQIDLFDRFSCRE